MMNPIWPICESFAPRAMSAGGEQSRRGGGKVGTPARRKCPPLTLGQARATERTCRWVRAQKNVVTGAWSAPPKDATQITIMGGRKRGSLRVARPKCQCTAISMCMPFKEVKHNNESSGRAGKAEGEGTGNEPPKVAQ